MKAAAPVLLFVEDTPADCELAVAMLERRWPGLAWERVEGEAAFRDAVLRQPDLIIADLEVPGFGAVAALGILAESGSRIPLLVYSGAISVAQRDECVRLGAAGCLTKDRWSELAVMVQGLLHPQLIATR
ncbi:MAG: response regulator [Steroidobacteraceae bacterium]